ncbi:nucleoside phosphorylase domain-containing protein [Corynascus novoguineensis]|uniref:Nucleoside phosphorylase domain-containing protein n=1 Tax=Corynascus novoguineensis TaxID=1126955 RepID=A0AAN7CTQ8_9PEZI|nr:nucleoside phosphorylase domain-containing protein [Corynascus novoguineensis]
MPEDSFSEPPRKRLRPHNWEDSAESQRVPDFRIAIVCALSVEYDAVFLLFDAVWDENGEQYGRARGDTNHYTTGRIGEHDVVLALLPDIGKAPAAGAAASIRSSYPNLKVALLVGICGGVPKVGLNELLLGDVVVAEMVVRYDFGRQYHDRFVPKDTTDDDLGKPNKDIRNLIAMVRSETGKERTRQSAIKHLICLQKAAISKQRSCDYRYPGFAEDKLFASAYRHKHRGPRLCVSCDGEDQTYCADAVKAFCEELECDEAQLVPRSRLGRKRNLEPEAAQPPEIFVGRVASGDVVMKSCVHRDKIAREHNVIAFEMEGAGVWDEIPCIVIKGISDYADSHKSKVWQPFAAATAAAVAKAVLERYTRTDDCYSSTRFSDLKERNRKYLKDLRITDPRHDKIRIEQTKGGLLAGLHRWILDNADFQRWQDDEQSRLLWIKGDPGKGKTMLLCGIIKELEPQYHLSFFFCQASDPRVNNATAVLRGLIYLLVDQQPSLISHVQKKYDAEGDPLFRDVNAWVALSEIFIAILEDPTLPPTRLIIDALDECIEGLDLLLGLVVRTSSVYSGVKWIVSSRNWPIIEKILDTATQKVRLSLELNEESVSAAVTTYIQFKVDWLAERNWYSNDTRDAVECYLSTNAYGTFLWGHGGSVNAVAWSHDSTRLASASDDGTVKIWDAVTGQCVSTLEGHGRLVNAVAWSHDSTRLASASYDGTVKIWDPATGQCVSTLQIGHSIENPQFHNSNPNKSLDMA